MLESSGLNCCSVCLAVLCHGVSVRFCRPRCWVYPFCPNHFARLSSCLASSSQTMMDTFGNHLAPYVYLCKLELVTPFHHEPSGNLDVGAPIVFAPGGQDKCRVCEQNLCHLSLGSKRVGRKSQYSNLVFDRSISRRVFLEARSFALLCVQSIHSRQSGSVICSAQFVVTIIRGHANKNECKEVNSGRAFFIHIPRLVLFSSTLSGCVMSRGSILRLESCKLNCNMKR